MESPPLQEGMYDTFTLDDEKVNEYSGADGEARNFHTAVTEVEETAEEQLLKESQQLNDEQGQTADARTNINLPPYPESNHSGVPGPFTPTAASKVIHSTSNHGDSFGGR